MWREKDRQQNWGKRAERLKYLIEGKSHAASPIRSGTGIGLNIARCLTEEQMLWKAEKNCLQNYPRSDFYVVAFNGVLWSCISWFSNHTCSQLAEKGVRLLSSSCSPSEDHWICNDLFLSTFYLSVKQNEWQDTYIWWKSQNHKQHN